MKSKKLLLLTLSALALCGCNNSAETPAKEIAPTCDCKHYTYTFKVEGHITAFLTSEVQETTHEPYLAYCKSGVNDCFIEIPYGDEREELELVYTGYVITYTLGFDGNDTKVSNNGWMLAE